MKIQFSSSFVKGYFLVMTLTKKRLRAKKNEFIYSELRCIQLHSSVFGSLESTTVGTAT